MREVINHWRPDQEPGLAAQEATARLVRAGSAPSLLSFLLILSFLLALSNVSTHAAGTNIWTYSSGNSNWNNVANWSLAHVPTNGEFTILDGSVVQLTNDTADLGALLITNGATLYAYAGITNGSPDFGLLISVSGAVTIASSSWIYPYSDDTNGGSPLIRCQSLLAASGGGIDADRKGYKGGKGYDDAPAGWEKGCGPGGSQYSNHGSGGAGYGGKGGTTISYGGATYGDYTAPLFAGSGGGGTRYASKIGGDGGGLIRIQASGNVTIDGMLRADGEDTTNRDAGAGSGGGIHIACDTISGTGEIRATGGDGRGKNNTLLEERSGGGGGGGRIAVVYNTTSQAGLGTQPDITFDVGGGISTPFNHIYYRLSRGRPGTLYFPDDIFFNLDKVRGAQFMVPGFTSLTTNALTISDGSFVFPTGFTLNVSQDLTITSRGGIELTDSACTINGDLIINSTGPGHAYFHGGPTASLSIGTNLSITGGWMEFDFRNGGSNALDVAGDLSMINAGLYIYGNKASATTVHVGEDWLYTNPVPDYNALRLEMHSGITNDSSPDHGLLIAVDGDMSVEDTCWVYLYSQNTNGGSPLFQVRNLTVANGGAFTADGGGFSGGIYAIDGYNPPGYGPGATIGGTYGSGGAGYGGMGGQGPSASYPGGISYGSSNAPVHPGSGGGSGQTSSGGGSGGGLVHLEVGNVLTVNGTLSANGAQGKGGNDAPGSGGGIYLTCNYLVGSVDGLLSANGVDGKGSTLANRGSGGSGGGRILVIYNRDTNNWLGAAQAIGGLRGGLASDPDFEDGDPGTIVFKPGPIPAIITNMVPSAVTGNSANLNGYLTSTGTSAVGTWVLWGLSDGGTNLGAWEQTNKFEGYQSVGAIGTNVTLSSDTAYTYRFYATNAGGVSWADPAQFFFTAAVWMDAPDTNASEAGLDVATVRVHRPAWATNGSTTVFYSLGGSASNGMDYELLSGEVVIPAGETNASITLVPQADAYESEGIETVIFTLTNSAHIIGAMNTATVFIADASVDPTNFSISVGNWTDPAIWSSGHKPVDGQTAIITHDILLAEPTAWMDVVTISNSTLTFTNWSTKLRAIEIDIQNGATLTLPPPFDETGPANRVALAGSNITLHAGALIDVDAKGYNPQNGPGAGGYDDGLTYYGGGGAYGGYGGPGNPINEPGGTTYGSASMPLLPGSGGGGYRIGRPDGGHGGGAVSIEATGQVVINGTLTANGGDGTGGSKGSGGSGGGVYISCLSFAGTSGVIRANGGGNSTYGSPGGGRIAVDYNTAAQIAQNAVDRPTVQFIAKEGAGSNRGRPGTLYFTDSGFYPGITIRGGLVVIPGMTELGRDSLTSVDGLAIFTNLNLTISNALTIAAGGGLEITNGGLSVADLDVSGGEIYVYGGLAFGNTDLTISGVMDLILTNQEVRVPGTLTVASGGNLRLLRDSGLAPSLLVGSNLLANGGTLTCYGSLSNTTVISVGGDMVLTNSGLVYIYSGMTNATGTNYGFLVSVTGDMCTASGGWLYPESHYLDGGSPRIQVNNLNIGSGSGINANSRGFSGGIFSLGGYNPHGYGPGGSVGSGYGSGGAGYGGEGGQGPAGSGTPGGVTYGDSNAPALPGSGGAGGQVLDGYRGGGQVRLDVNARATVDGTITANGANAAGYRCPGSGGGIYITCRYFDGAGTGSLTVHGGNGSSQFYPDRGSGGGGGGRIAIVYVFSTNGWSGTATATGGLKGEDDPDTQPGNVGTVVFLHNPLPSGTLFLFR